MKAITNDTVYVEDTDKHLLIPVMDAFEKGLRDMGYVLSDKDLDEILDVLLDNTEKLISDIFPNSDYRNYN